MDFLVSRYTALKRGLGLTTPPATVENVAMPKYEDYRKKVR